MYLTMQFFNNRSAKNFFLVIIIINESGQILEVDEILVENNVHTVRFSDEDGNELIETFNFDCVMGFIDNSESSSYNQYGDKIEVHESEGKK
jgi:hypothetical protein